LAWRAGLSNPSSTSHYDPAEKVMRWSFRSINPEHPVWITVDLSGIAGSFSVEWFNPATGAKIMGEPVAGGGRRSLSAPFAPAAAFSADAVLHLVQVPDNGKK
jgi:hypothetical protein